MTPEELKALADRMDAPIRHLNPYGPDAKERLTPEQYDLMWPCVNLRRYAFDKVKEEAVAAPGRVYMRGFKLERVTE